MNDGRQILTEFMPIAASSLIEHKKIDFSAWKYNDLSIHIQELKIYIFLRLLLRFLSRPTQQCKQRKLFRCINESQLIHLISILAHKSHNLPPGRSRERNAVTRARARSQNSSQARRSQNIEISSLSALLALAKLSGDPVL
jgi:hypothetical protein